MNYMGETKKYYEGYLKNNSINKDIIGDLYISYGLLKKPKNFKINIISIFFHEIVIFLTSWVIVNNSYQSYNKKANLPFVSTTFINEQEPDYSFSKSPILRWNFKFKLLSFISKILPFKKQISISNLIPGFFLKKIILFITFNYRLNLPKKSLIFFKNKSEEFNHLEETIKKISSKYNLSINQFKINAFLSYVDQFITDEDLTDSDDLITGSNLNINNRILSANSIKNNKKVISTDHSKLGLSCLDEPLFGYGEFAFLTDYFDNRKFALKNKRINFSSKINIHQNSINLIQKNKIFTSINPNLKYLYIPTSFSENYLYGPFRNFEDNLYYKWQNTMLNFFNDLNITIKLHPKTKFEFEYAKSIKLNLGKLEEELKSYDIIIMDYISSAFSSAMLSKLPVIFFNLNNRIVNKSALENIKKSCIYFEINLLDNIKIQLEKVRKDLKHERLIYYDFQENYLINPKSSTHKKISKILNG